MFWGGEGGHTVANRVGFTLLQKQLLTHCTLNSNNTVNCLECVSVSLHTSLHTIRKLGSCFISNATLHRPLTRINTLILQIFYTPRCCSVGITFGPSVLVSQHTPFRSICELSWTTSKACFLQAPQHALFSGVRNICHNIKSNQLIVWCSLKDPTPWVALWRHYK